MSAQKVKLFDSSIGSVKMIKMDKVIYVREKNIRILRTLKHLKNNLDS